MVQPSVGLTTKVLVPNIVDGATVDVQIVKNIRVRLKDCWCPETRTRDLEEKEKGLAAKDHMESLLAQQELYFGDVRYKEVVLHIPADEEGDIKDILTMNRVLGYIFVNGEDVSARMVADGHATKEKKKK